MSITGLHAAKLQCPFRYFLYKTEMEASSRGDVFMRKLDRHGNARFAYERERISLVENLAR